jgi:trehalose 6-phosphate synthase
VQVGVPSRTKIPAYQALDAEIDRVAAALNKKWGTERSQPVRIFKEEYTEVQLMGLHRLATFCMVSPLHDGMNLVAKEFVASRFDEDGVLILSSFAGAALELNDALLVNPFSTDQMAEAILRAITMAPAERRKRMQRMRAATAENSIYRWAAKILLSLLRIESFDSLESEPARRSIGGVAGARSAGA